MTGARLSCAVCFLFRRRARGCRRCRACSQRSLLPSCALVSVGNRLEGSEGPLASSSTLHTVVRIKMGSFWCTQDGRLVVAFLSRVILLTVSFKDLSDRHSSLSGLGIKL